MSGYAGHDFEMRWYYRFKMEEIYLIGAARVLFHKPQTMRIAKIRKVFYFLNSKA